MKDAVANGGVCRLPPVWSAHRRLTARMFFWFIGTAVVTVWLVFRDPAFDYRLLIVGAVAAGTAGRARSVGARVLHSVTFSVAAARGADARHRWASSRSARCCSGCPSAHCCTWSSPGRGRTRRVFWWPFGGFSFDGARIRSQPAVGGTCRSNWSGLALCWWVVRQADLRDPERRAAFWHTGRLSLPIE